MDNEAHEEALKISKVRREEEWQKVRNPDVITESEFLFWWQVIFKKEKVFQYDRTISSFIVTASFDSFENCNKWKRIEIFTCP